MAQETRPLVDGKFLEYLDKPLVREENTICYGDLNEKCILILEIMTFSFRSLIPRIPPRSSSRE